MKYNTFSSAIPCLPRECSYWVEEGVHLGTDLRAFSSPSAIFTGTACGCPSTGAAGLEPPAWFLALREDHIKHKWPHHMGPLLCESMLWCTSLTLPCLHLAVPAPCASPHSKNTRQQFFSPLLDDLVTPIQLGCAGYCGFLSAHLCRHVNLATMKISTTASILSLLVMFPEIGPY